MLTVGFVATGEVAYPETADSRACDLVLRQDVALLGVFQVIEHGLEILENVSHQSGPVRRTMVIVKSIDLPRCSR